MKFLDDVIVVNDNKQYSEHGITKGQIGTIISAEIRDNCFLIVFPGKNIFDDDIFVTIKIEDLKLLKDNKCKDSAILEDLPKQNPKWWCKVENGYIVNLLGERKNKIPYDYKS